MIALALGTPRVWFEVDFTRPSAALVALGLQAAFVSLGYAVLGSLAYRKMPFSTLEMLAAANPIVCLLGFTLYRIAKPFGPEIAYLGPFSASLLGVGFPLFLAAAWMGSRGRSPAASSRTTAAPSTTS
jgi:hypothetical protein